MVKKLPTCNFLIACGRKVVYIAVAGRSNGLGLVIAANSVSPVINCPPSSASESISRDIWSSLDLPSGIVAMTSPTRKVQFLFFNEIYE